MQYPLLFQPLQMEKNKSSTLSYGMNTKSILHIEEIKQQIG